MCGFVVSGLEEKSVFCAFFFCLYNGVKKAVVCVYVVLTDVTELANRVSKVLFFIEVNALLNYESTKTNWRGYYLI